MNKWRMVRLTNTTCEDYGCRPEPDYSSGIYMAAVKEAQCRIVADKRRKQDEVKQNLKRENSVKMEARIIKQWSSYYNTLYIVTLLGYTCNQPRGQGN